MANYNTIGDCYDTLKTLKTECPFSLDLLRLPLASVAPLAEKGVAGKGAAALVPASTPEKQGAKRSESVSTKIRNVHSMR